MSKGLVLEFTKMHGAGNDFIVIDNRFYRFSRPELSDLAVRFCERRLGVGADGLLALDVPDTNDVDYRMRYHNADGSLGEMCGNGARCLAAFARDGGIESDPLVFSSDAGTYEARIIDGTPPSVRLDFEGPSEVNLRFTTVEVEPGMALDFAYVVAGVPHAVRFVDDVAHVPVDRWGRSVHDHESFASTRGSNVDFVQVSNSDGLDVLDVRTFERGVEGETLACGTGALSSVAAASARGLIGGRDAVVRMPGGEMRAGYVDGGSAMFLEGPVAFVYRGTVTV